MTISKLLVLTDGQQTGARSLIETVRIAVDAGARTVILREKHTSTADRRALAGALRPLLHEVGGQLIVASLTTIEADGVHLAEDDPFPEERPAIVGRSCHDVHGVRRATMEGCDYVTVSPIFSTASKPGYGPGLGLGGLRDLVDDFELGTDDAPAAPLRADGRPMPIYALGGIDADMAGVCVRAGATGVAVMGAIMRAPDPGAVVHALRHALKECDCGSLDVPTGRRRSDDTLDIAQALHRGTWQLGEVDR